MRAAWTRTSIAGFLAVLLVAGGADPAGALDSPKIRAARSALEAARADAVAAAQAYVDASAELGRLDERLRLLEARIPRTEARIRELRAVLAARAAALYEGGGGSGLTVLDNLANGTDLVDAQRVAHLADTAQSDTRIQMDTLDDEKEQLRRDQATVADLRTRQDDLVALTQALTEDLAEKVERANGTLRRAEQEEALRRYQATVAAQQAAQQAAATAASVSGETVADPQEQAAPADPSLAAEIPVDNLVCPVQGLVTFVDDWGQPRSGWRVHQGTDMFAIVGTPNVAVADGTAQLRVGGLGGNVVWLYTDDGNAYYYAHLDRFEGTFASDGTRRVVQGEVIGYTGNTGNAAGGPTHTHFEIRPRRIGPINPYPMLRDMCAVEAGLEPAPTTSTTGTSDTTVTDTSTLQPAQP